MLYQDYLSQSFPLSFYHCSSVAVERLQSIPGGLSGRRRLSTGEHVSSQHLFNNWYRDLAMDKMATAAVVTGIVIMVLVLLLQKAWERED